MSFLPNYLDTPAMSSTNFAENFWEEDITSVHGFDTLVKRLRDGKKLCQDFEDFLKARAKLEEAYAKELAKLVKNAHGESSTGTMRDSWESLKFETEACSREHFAVSQRIGNELECMCKDFKDKQRDERKKAEDAVKKAHALLKAAALSEQKAKQDYYQKARTAEKLEEAASKPGKKTEDALLKAKRAQSASIAAEAVYREAVTLLDSSQSAWEKEMEAACKVFQALEEERISFMRTTMWRYCNIGSSMAVQEDEMYEVVRRSLERCDIDADLREFVDQKRTGNKRPPRAEYQSYADALSTPDGASAGNASLRSWIPNSISNRFMHTSSSASGFHDEHASYAGDPDRAM